jgi:hypothetical protein
MNSVLKGLLYILLTFLIGCDYVDGRLKILNESNKLIFFSWQEDSTLSRTPIITHYTSLMKDKITNEYPINTTLAVLPYSENTIPIWNYKGWDKYFHKNKTLYLFIFDDDTLKKYAWDTICMKQKYLRRFNLTYSDIKSSKWKIKYSKP